VFEAFLRLPIASHDTSAHREILLAVSESVLRHEFSTFHAVKSPTFTMSYKQDDCWEWVRLSANRTFGGQGEDLWAVRLL
jgi:hypothetical protein